MRSDLSNPTDARLWFGAQDQRGWRIDNFNERDRIVGELGWNYFRRRRAA
jgi:hypothetical protein